MNNMDSPITDRESRDPAITPRFSVTRITQGLAFGEGSITSNIENTQVLADMDKIIHESLDIIQPVDTDDDGCSDGRETTEIYDQNGKIEQGPFNRAKVFGGAVAMTSASLIGLGRGHGKSLQAVFDESVAVLYMKRINFGAHTDDSAHSPNCGCGAIDKAPEALLAALKYENQIRSVIAVLGVDSSGIEDVFSNFRDYVAHEMTYDEEYSGSKVINQILSVGKIVKKLAGDHRERRIVLNQVKGYTTNQKLIRDSTQGLGQVFAVDTWRLEDIATGLFPEQAKLQHQTFLSGLIYTLAVSAVLTKGDLPVDMMQIVV